MNKINNSGCFVGDPKFKIYKDDYYKKYNIVKMPREKRGMSDMVSCKCSFCKENTIMKEQYFTIYLRNAMKNNEEYIYSCKKCSGNKSKGSLSSNWKGGKYIQDRTGYIIVLVKDSELYLVDEKRSNHKHNRMYEHRYLMSKKLDRPLKRCEIVHHINGIKDDNRIENLELIDATTHTSITAIESKWEAKIKDLEEENRKLKEQLLELLD